MTKTSVQEFYGQSELLCHAQSELHGAMTVPSFWVEPDLNAFAITFSDRPVTVDLNQVDYSDLSGRAHRRLLT